ncbi:LANO_0E10594g1_1 [Lachancea nothofagi CBS 11611]|uniref:LANO_0E10594g1_1 n=1 Tax=Lachancea nothofagi CBS 11611 TaxID=1266666 RepID=A0A1G4JX12_9SACH|nr:LANO_0E10594g1_1 [Lachancea nothofagi CBS 11611]
MGVKKRPLSGGSGSRVRAKRADNYDACSLLSTYKFMSRKNTSVDKVIRKSVVLVSLTNEDVQFIQNSQLTQELKSKNLDFVLQEDGLSYLCAWNFRALELALILGFVFGNKGKQWLGKTTKDPWYVPREIPLRGSFYVHKSCKLHSGYDKAQVGITVSKFIDLADFTEVSVNTYGLTSMVEAISSFSSSINFRKPHHIVKEEFSNSLKALKLKNKIAMTTLPFLDKDILTNAEELSTGNAVILEKSKASLTNFVESLINHNEIVPSTEKETTDGFQQVAQEPEIPRRTTGNTSRYSGNTSSVPSQTSTRENTNRNTNGRTLDTQSRGMNANYLTQDQIRDYCVASVRASIEAVKAKSPYQILKTYIKCPRQHYVDLVYDNLNRLRSETNCNIVVMNLNNVHESASWFDSLDVAKHTKGTAIISVPHPSTVRAVSIGGIGEHNVKALQLLLELLETNA